MITVNGKDSTYRSTFASSSSSRVFSQVGCHIGISKYLTKKGLHLRRRRRRQQCPASFCRMRWRLRRRTTPAAACAPAAAGAGAAPPVLPVAHSMSVQNICNRDNCMFETVCTSILGSLDLGWSATSVTSAVSAWPKRIERWKYEKLLDKKILLRKKPQIY